MSILVIPILIIVVGLPIAWLVSEFRSNKRSIRCVLGILSILSCFGIAWLTAQFVRLNYNAWYGFAFKSLIDASIEKMENGKTDVVLKELKILQDKFQPTYENRANYNELVTEAADKIKGQKASNKFASPDPEPQGGPVR